MPREREACGRCSTSVVVDVATADAESDPDPYDEARIEVEAETLRALSPAGRLSRVARRLNAAVDRFTWGR